jgi:uncharacterized protein YbaP (TraB family)
MRGLISALTLMLLLVGWSLTARAEAPAKQTTVIAKPALWQVTVPGKPGTLVLLGTIHLLPAHIRWVDTPAVAQAISRADRLVLELTPDEMANPAMQKEAARLGLAEDGKGLSSYLPVDVLERTNTLAVAAGLPSGMAEMFKPWMLSLVLAVDAAQKAGLDPDKGVDKVLGDAFAAKRKPIIGLESGLQQIRFFAGMSDKVAVAMLTETLDELENAPAFFRDMATAWARGDEAALADRFLASLKETPEAYKVLMVDRNKAWLPKLDTQLSAKGTTLVAVGAGHVVGEDGLVALLRAKGYTLTRIQ